MNHLFTVVVWIFMFLLLLGGGAAFADNSFSSTRAASLSPSDIEKARLILKYKCGQCHTPEDPEEHLLQDWPKLMRFMTPMAGLRRSEVELLGRYAIYQHWLENQKKKNDPKNK